MNSKNKFLFLIFFCLLIFSLSSPFSFVNSKKSPKILTILGLGFGESYFLNKDIMNSYGWELVVASTTTNVISCINKDLPNEVADVLIQDIEENDLDDYDCVFVPSGGHWANLVSLQIVLDLIKEAHEQNITIAGICTGMIVLAFAEILEGVEVASNSHASSYLYDAGAIMVASSVVSDQGIVTGGFGGGLSIGAEGAPNEEFCEAINTELDLGKRNLLTIILPSVLGGLILIGTIILMIISKGKIGSIFRRISK